MTVATVRSSSVLGPDNSIAVVLGTRPEMIKLAPLIRLLGRRARVVHTGQHFDDNLSGCFLRDLGIGDPAVTLGLGGSQSRHANRRRNNALGRTLRE